MRSYNPNFYAALQQTTASPRFVVAIHFADDDIVYFTQSSDTETPLAATVVESCIKGITSASQKIDYRAAKSSIGGITVELADVGSQLTGIFNNRIENDKGLRRKKIVIHQGFIGLDWDDYEVEGTYLINGRSMKDGIYVFTCDDIQREERKDIFEPKNTNLAKSITATQTYIPITASTFDFFDALEHDASYSDRPSQTVFYVKVDNEIICCSGGYAHPIDGNSLIVVQRGALNTAAAAHESEADKSADRKPKIEEVIYLEGPALKIIYALQTGILYDQSTTLPDHWHCGIPEEFVRLTDYENAGSDLWNPTDNTGLKVRFVMPKKGDAKAFIEKQCLFWMGGMRPIYADGSVGFKRMAAVLSDSAYQVEITQDQLVDHSDLEFDDSEVVNYITIMWNWDHVKTKFTKQTSLVDGNSIVKWDNGEAETWELYGVHTASHTDSQIIQRFQAWRDRFAGPPKKIEITLDRRFSYLEVGDTIRLSIDQLRDEVTGAELNSTFEVNQRRYDASKGTVSFSLVASSEKAGAINDLSDDYVLEDDFYDQEGTELSTVLTISGGVVTANGALTGENLLEDAIYYYTGNLEIQSGVTVTMTKNVQLRVMGFLTINGSLTTIGQGMSGGAGHITDPIINNDIALTKGVVGFIGSTQSSWGLQGVIISGVLKFNGYTKRTPDTLTIGENSNVPFFNLRNIDGMEVLGSPNNLRGTGGSGGGACRIDIATRANGANGGSGGGGLLIISRGGSFGVSGVINTSGNAGGTYNTVTSGAVTIAGGSGGAGFPGAVLWLLDGSSTPPELASHHTANRGACPNAGFQSVATGNGVGYSPSGSFQNYYLGWSGGAYPNSTSGIQFIPPREVIEEEQNNYVPDVTSLTASQNGANVVFVWTKVNSDMLRNYEIRYTSSGSTWENAQFLSSVIRGNNVYSTAAIPPGTWTFYIKAYDINNFSSANAASATLTVVSTQDIVSSKNWHPDFPGNFLYRTVVDNTYDPALMDFNFCLASNSPEFNTEWGNTGPGGGRYRITILDGDNPCGGVTYRKITESQGVTGTHSLDNIVGGIEDGLITITAVVKKLGRRWFHIRNVASFDLDNGVVGGYATGVTPEIADLGGGWYACSAVCDHIAAYLGISASDNDYPSYNITGDSTKGFYFAGGQVRNSNGYTSFIKTIPYNTVYDFVRHEANGYLSPNTLNVCADDGYDTFEPSELDFTPNCRYEPLEQDGLTDATTRVYALISTKPFLNLESNATPEYFIDYKTTAGSYDGYEPWTIGDIYGRYVQNKLEMNTDNGACVIDGFTTVMDAQEIIDSGTNVTIDVAGTTINFTSVFRSAPHVDVNIVGGTVLYPQITALSATSFTIKIINSSGTSVGGTLSNWRATGI